MPKKTGSTKTNKPKLTKIVEEGFIQAQVMGFSEGGAKTYIKHIKVTPFVTEPARVSIFAHRTIKTADYDGIKLGVTINLPCYKEQVMETIDEIEDMVDAYMEKRVLEIADGINPHEAVLDDGLLPENMDSGTDDLIAGVTGEDGSSLTLDSLDDTATDDFSDLFVEDDTATDDFSDLFVEDEAASEAEEIDPDDLL